MRLLKQEPDSKIQDTIDFMSKVDESTRDKICSYADYAHHKYQLELEKKQNINQRLQIIKPGGMV